MDNPKESPFACDLTVLSRKEKERVLQLLDILKQQIQDVRETPDCYEFTFPSSTELIQAAGEFISYERLCCPFFDFHLIVDREGGPLRLQFTGREGVKEFIRFEFGLEKNPGFKQ